ncbi:MAG: phenylacetate--CoA ligase family protein [Lentisphaerae bacterium]|jgi:phenylacetate-CoA ligase|nr:phenylacetate--CoA ligase family protein [Lentisphaerota bacterium]MBT4819667.1 phenylacetate--CoA ligase family protein [Lentisphaerota bacterium]MBT5608049.1 phenylacetate--CoA ligase family protein [Lentisphaerota bacterium]MBT7056483.1 phenylacetate--CoA ligase family protein [Lentisphaerota bacterium]MBT7840714.1 phenylacetate--CoA ligase family protein [Lentisphaerota bacterium]
MSTTSQYHFVRHGEDVSLVMDSPRFRSRLTRFLTRLQETSPFYAERLLDAGVSPTDDPVEALGALPVTTKEEYRNTLYPEALKALDQRPFTADLSSGSTAHCVLRLNAPEDELAEQAVTETVFKRAGMRQGDHFVCLEVGVPEIYDFYFRAARHLGARQTTFLRLTSNYATSVAPLAGLRPNVVLTLPSLMVRAWPHIRSIWTPDTCPVRSFIHMGEALHPELKREIQEAWGCGVYSFYGTTEIGGMGGECDCANGCHFDPEQICPTLQEARPLGDGIYEGEVFLTTLHLHHQAMVKYQVGDVARLDDTPCPCGDPLPRLSFVERTNDSFILTGDKFRYAAILEGLKAVVPAVRFMSIGLEDASEERGNTLMTVSLPEELHGQADKIMEALKFHIFELDSAFHGGFVRFALEFLPPEKFDERKIRKVIDRRKHLGI